MRFLVLRWLYLALPLLFLLAGCSSSGGSAPPEEEHSGDGEAHVTVRTELAKLGTLIDTVEAMGRCEALPDHIAMLTPAVEGHVHELLVGQGDVVRKGSRSLNSTRRSRRPILRRRRQREMGSVRLWLCLNHSLVGRSAGSASWQSNKLG